MAGSISSWSNASYVPSFDTGGAGATEAEGGALELSQPDAPSLGSDLLATAQAGSASELAPSGMGLDVAGPEGRAGDLDWLVAEQPDAKAAVTQAKQKADQLFTNADAKKSDSMPDEVVLVKDALDVNRGENSKSFRWNSENVAANQASASEATRQIASNQGLETDALGQLGTTQQAQYQTVKGMTSEDPQARLALQTMLVDGRLTGAKPNSQGKDLLGTLADVSSEKVAKGIDQKALVSDLVQEIQDPGAINQQNRNTCTVTALEIKVATENPAEYARIVGGLASASGQAKLANGETMTRVPGTETGDDTPRTQSARLWESAAMNYGVKGTGAVYDNTQDEFVNAKTGKVVEPQRDAAFVDRIRAGVEGGPGLTAHNLKVEAQDAINQDLGNGGQTAEGKQLLELAQQRPLTAADADAAISSYRSREIAPKLTEQIKAATDAGGTVLVGINYAKSGNHGEHEVLVNGFEKDAQGQEWVKYNNPWGQVEKMPREAFEKRLLSAAL